MISINYRDPRPMYEQVRDELRRLIIMGAFSPGEKLSTVRELAASLAINPNTIARAYRELEAEGYILSKTGRGTFVAESGDVSGARRDALLERLDDTARELLHLGVERAALAQRLENLMTQGGQHDTNG